MSSQLSRRHLLRLTAGGVAGGALAAAGPIGAPPAAADTVVPIPAAAEPDIQSALTWWPPARQVWTPLGWKGHLFRFNQFYNGTVVCEPGAVLAGPKPDVVPYQGKNFQVTVTMPNPDGSFAPFPTVDGEDLWNFDLGLRKQGWTAENDTPLLWTDFPRQEGLVLRQSVFAHVKGGQPVQTAIEPIYAWIRFAINHVDERAAPGSFSFALRLSKAFYKLNGQFNQQEGVPMVVRPGVAALDGPLRTDRIYNPSGKPLNVPIYDSAGNVRLMVSTPEHGTIALTPNSTHSGVYDLVLGLPVKVGTYVDILVPMLPQPVDEANRELALGRDGALAECEKFWQPTEATVAGIATPEPYVTDFFRRAPELAQIVAEKSTDTQLFTFLSGSYAYDVLWSTPTSMISHMFLDLLGYHDVVEQHIEIYKATQGSRTPPGPVFDGRSWPGYLATPASLQAIDWMSDHGAILEILSSHALLTNRQAFIDRWLDPIVKACDFIKQACALTNHNGVQGLVPPAVNTDEGIVTQGFGSQAWTYKGLRSAIRLLQRVNHPRAAEFDTFATGFQQTFGTAIRALAAKSATWTDQDGQPQPVLPASFTGERGSFPELVMFDTGALMSVWAGLLPADDPLMRSYVEFFRVGPNTQLFDSAHHNALDRVVLDHEQSSAEPCYSWNLFHTWQRGDRTRYLEGMYGLFAGAISQDTYISCEHRNAIYGNLFAAPLITWAARHAVIDDEIVDGDLHLLRLCPLAWVSTQTTIFDRIPTRFGPVSLRFTLSADRGTLTVTFASQWHHRPGHLVLHPPPVPGLQSVVVNGQTYGSDQPIGLAL
ncbi:hypothetical protein GCM10009765_21310 [Fodinicola feengrottensis]|uniref:Tat pathway signal sequence domain protein n=1 Tax=Fodinicola feengrottensis TaxID=435914 RepID=A0ABN2GI68_9ACTN